MLGVLVVDEEEGVFVMAPTTLVFVIVAGGMFPVVESTEG